MDCCACTQKIITPLLFLHKKRFVMKKIISIFFCITWLSHTMEKAPQPKKACAWNAKLYSLGNRLQETKALHILNNSGITLQNKVILDVGSGTGNISAIMAKTAKNVYGIDACPHMTLWAIEKYGCNNKLSFHEYFIEDFRPTHLKFNLVTSFFCLHWVKDKPKALQNIYDCLQPGGDFLGTVVTAADIEHSPDLQAFLEMVPGLQTIVAVLQNINPIDALGSSYPTDNEYKTMITNTGFEIVSFEPITTETIFQNRDEIMALHRPIAMSRPIAQWIPTKMHEFLFQRYISIIMKKLTRDEDGNYLYPSNTTIVHARKPDNTMQ